MAASAGAIWSAQFFRMEFGMPSGPGALCGSRSRRSFATPGVEMVICAMFGCVGFVMFGSGVVACLVNTDLNCWRSSLALVLLSVCSLFPSFSGATPRFSCFFALIHDQNGLVVLFCKPSLIFLLMYDHSAFLHSCLQYF